MKQIILGGLFLMIGGGLLGWVDLRIVFGVDLIVAGAFLVFTSNEE